MKASSLGLLVFTKVSAAVFTRSRLSRMLPLLSITSPTLIGMSSRLNRASFCSTLSSRTRKFSCLRSGTNRPRSSRTVACSTTKLTSRWMRKLSSCFCAGGAVCCPGSCGGAGCCAWAPVPVHTPASASRMREVKRETRLSLVAGGIVARLGVHVEGGQSPGRAQLDLDLPPAGMALMIVCLIPKTLLMAQLLSVFRRRIGRVFRVLPGETPPAGQLRQFAQQRMPVQFFRCAPVTHRVVDADGIELNVGLLDEVFDVAFRVPTMIIASVGYNEQGPFGVVCTPHLAQAQVDGIEQGGAAVRRGVHQARLQLLDTVGEAAGQLRPVVETHQEEFILRACSLEELHGRQPRLVHFVGHTAAQIEDHADRNGHILAGEVHHLLFRAVFKDAEVLLFEAGHQAIKGIGDCDVDQHEVHVHFDGPFPLGLVGTNSARTRAGCVGQPLERSLAWRWGRVVWFRALSRDGKCEQSTGQEQRDHRSQLAAHCFPRSSYRPFCGTAAVPKIFLPMILPRMSKPNCAGLKVREPARTFSAPGTLQAAASRRTPIRAEGMW